MNFLRLWGGLKIASTFLPPDWSVAAPLFGAGLLVCILNSWAWNSYVSDLIAFAAARNPMPYFSYLMVAPGRVGTHTLPFGGLEE